MVKKLQKEISDILVEALLAEEYLIIDRGLHLVDIMIMGVNIKLWLGTGALHQHTEEEPIVRFTWEEALAIKDQLQQSEKSALEAQRTELQNKLKKVEEALTEVQDCATIATDLTGEVQDV